MLRSGGADLAQHFGDDQHAGGFGYDKESQRAYTDLNNTHYSLDAMRRTQSAEDLRPSSEKKADINWDAALKYWDTLRSDEGAHFDRVQRRVVQKSDKFREGTLEVNVVFPEGIVGIDDEVLAHLFHGFARLEAERNLDHGVHVLDVHAAGRRNLADVRAAGGD